MARTYECPKCGHDATAKDVNVAKDIMLCPVCGEVSCFSEVANRIMEAEREDDGMRGAGVSRVLPVAALLAALAAVTVAITQQNSVRIRNRISSGLIDEYW